MNRYTIWLKDGTMININAHHTSIWREIQGYEQLDFFLNDEYGNEAIIAIMNLRDVFKLEFKRLPLREYMIKI